MAMLLVDLIIVIVLAVYGVIGYRYGFIGQTIELLIFVAGFLVALSLYQPIGAGFLHVVHLPRSLVDLAVFIVLWMGLEFGLGFGWRYLRRRIPKEIRKSEANRIAGIAPGLLKGVVLLAITLLIIASAPLPSSVKRPLTEATLSKGLLSLGTGFQQQFNNVFGSVFRDTLAFRTIKTEGDQSVPLGFTSAGTVCADDERTMLDLVNRERTSRGLKAVRADDQLRDVGQAHSRDMLARGYFSHITPEGVDPFQRMDAAGIRYSLAGENLAYAPTVDIAHTGLMNSQGHRENILKPDFIRLGIGCIDAGYRGKMFSQEFAG